MKKLVLTALIATSALACKTASVSPSPVPGTTPQAVVVTSSAFPQGSGIPALNTCDGADQSPDLSWTSVPDSTKSIAIVVEDPDAPHGTFTHWIVWNILPSTRSLGGGGNGGLAGGMSGTNDFDHVGYSGPCPPKGSLHHYHFRVYGLDTTVALKQDAKRADLDKAMAGHVLASGELVGTFQH
ncbi:MAG TPA: YbhB/YbcL family Raf kinase inhibitor-like protein [Polyangiaceae bacterium]|jgi:hypothetical protein